MSLSDVAAEADTHPIVIGPLREGLPFGATVEGLRLAHLDDPEVRRSLYDLWIDRGVILFRGCESSPTMQVALSKVFGPLEQHLFPESRAVEDPELVNIKYYPDDGNIYEIDGRLIGGWLPWHSDLVYTHTINRGGILRPIQLPKKGGGQTGFIDQIAAYAALPEALKQRIEGLNVVYLMDINGAHQRFGVRETRKAVRFAQSAAAILRREWRYPRILHPMVYRQDETGRPVLNISPWFAAGIYELGGPEGEALLGEVVDHCIRGEQAYFHDWLPSDMVLWDNWRTLHCATGVAADDTRVMHRTTIAGDYAMGRKLDGGDDLPSMDV